MRTSAHRAMAALCVCGVASSIASAQTEFYRQNPQQVPGGYSSQDARNPGGLGWFSEVADDFPALLGQTLTNVKFWGGYVTAPNAPGATTGFTIRFYSDNAGSPGTMLFQQDVANFNETLYYTTTGTPLAEFSYSCDLSPGFVVPADGRLWVSAVAILPRGGTANEPQWGWAQSITAVAGASGQQWFFSPTHTFTPQGVDFGFVISGTTGGGGCYANCDNSTNAPILNSLDFGCFLTKFAQGDSYANCDNSSNPPVLNALDFGCFLTKFAAGCT